MNQNDTKKRSEELKELKQKLKEYQKELYEELGDEISGREFECLFEIIDNDIEKNEYFEDEE